MSGEPRNWPPIISGARRPAWIFWRDIAITLFMWGVFLVIVKIEFTNVWQKLPSLAGTSDYTGFGFSAIRAELKPAVFLIVLLVAVLGVSTLFSRRRRTRALLQPQPSAVPDEDLSSDLGMDRRMLETVRRQKVVTLDFDERGKASVAPITSA